MGRARSNSYGSNGGGGNRKNSKKASVAKHQKPASSSKKAPNMGSKKKGLTPIHDIFVKSNDGRVASRSSGPKSHIKFKTPPPVKPGSKKRQRQDVNNPNNSNQYTNNHSVEMGYALQLPPKDAGAQLHCIPWMASLLEQSNSSSHQQPPTKSTGKKKSKAAQNRLPTHDVDPQPLHQFSLELLEFAKYVRLTPREREAREGVIQELTQLAQRISNFEIPNAICPPPPPNQQERILQFRPFGSYAASDVCTFQSDVDLALWGAVKLFPLVRSNGPPKKEAVKTPQQEQQEKELQRQQKWKEALAVLDVENDMSPGNIPAAAAAGAATEEPSANDNGKNAPPLFVIDRVGGNNAGQEEDSKQPARPTVTEGDNNVTELEKYQSHVVDFVDGNDDDDASSSDEDSADKLERFADAEEDDVANAKLTEQFADADDDQFADAVFGSPNKKTRLNHFVTMSSSDDYDDDAMHKRIEEHFQKNDNEAEFHNMQVGFVGGGSDNDDDESEAEDEFVMPSPETHSIRKRDAVDALSKLNRKLQRSRYFATSINFIRHARVPIVKFMSQVGVEVDISIGGLNGADTSLYAAKQCVRYTSFAPVVLALKIIMGQQDLDTPFTGGLGSFKLYVLVAHHIQQHLELGGSDDPGEVFLSLVFRYGSAPGDQSIAEKARTQLFQDSKIQCEDGFEADLSNVYKITECCHLFDSVWKRLWGRVRNTGRSVGAHEGVIRTSLLAELIHVDRLTSERQQSLRMASAERRVNNPYRQTTTTMARPNSKPKPPPSQPKSNRNNKRPMDKTAAQIAAGYGIKSSEANVRPFKRYHR